MEIDKGLYEIGLDEKDAEIILQEISGHEIKREFIFNSFPRHTVAVDKILISKKLVTVSEYEEFAFETGYKSEAEIEGWGWVMEDTWTKKEGVSWMAPFGDSRDKIYLQKKDIFPVLMLTWNDAKAFCRWLSGYYSGVRLPSEFEWEVFAGYCGADEYSILSSVSADDFFCGLVDTIKSAMSPVRPGIVWEWTDSWFEIYPGGIAGREFGTTYKVLRGGSLASMPVQRKKEYRFRRCPTARSPFYGFRIARDVL